MAAQANIAALTELFLGTKGHSHFTKKMASTYLSLSRPSSSTQPTWGKRRCPGKEGYTLAALVVKARSVQQMLLYLQTCQCSGMIQHLTTHILWFHSTLKAVRLPRIWSNSSYRA